MASRLVPIFHRIVTDSCEDADTQQSVCKEMDIVDSTG